MRQWCGFKGGVAPALTCESSLRAVAGRTGGAAPRAPALRRRGAPDDLAGVIAFLLGPDARWVTGTVVEATGGLP